MCEYVCIYIYIIKMEIMTLGAIYNISTPIIYQKLNLLEQR